MDRRKVFKKLSLSETLLISHTIYNIRTQKLKPAKRLKRNGDMLAFTVLLLFASCGNDFCVCKIDAEGGLRQKYNFFK